MPPTALTITAVHPSGFTITMMVDAWEDLDATIADLLQRGYRPTSGAGDGWVRTAEGSPLCPQHKIPMRLREKQGDAWWSHQVVDPRTGELVYCRGFAGPSSPGWGVKGPGGA